MGKFLTVILAGALTTGIVAEGNAQDKQAAASNAGSRAATSEARARVACGTGRIISAQTLADGSIRVTCQQGAGVPRALLGLGRLSPEVTAAIAATVLMLPIILDDNDDIHTTTSSTTGTGVGP